MAGLFKTAKHSGRRAFLRGVGGTLIGLPLLELTHGHVFAAGDTPRRFLTVFSHGGTISNQSGGGGRFDGTGNAQGQDWFRPADPGEGLVLGPIMGSLAAVAPIQHMLLGPVTEGGDLLEPHRDKMVVFTGIDNKTGIRGGTYGGGHGSCNVSSLTASDIGNAGDEATASGPSIDHVLAERLAATYPARFNRLHFNVRGHQYGSPFHSGPSSRVSGEDSVSSAWSTVFEGVSADGPNPELLARQLRQQSILDGVRDGFGPLRQAASATDRLAIEEHLEHLSAIEREIQAINVSAMCTPPSDPGSVDDAQRRGELFADMIVAALRCGLTNVACLEIADIICDWTTHGNVMEASFHIGHSLHHYGRDVGPTGPEAAHLTEWHTEMLENRRWRMSLVARILAGLDAVPEGDGTMLDNSLLLYTSEFSNGARHDAANQPIMLAGSAGGAFQTGRHINYNMHDTPSSFSATEYASEESLQNLFTSILHAFGGTDEHFGNDQCDHRGPLPGLM